MASIVSQSVKDHIDNSYILYKLAEKLKATQELSFFLMEKSLEAIIMARILAGYELGITCVIRDEDLTNDLFLTLAEKRLVQKYPGLDLSNDPATELKYSDPAGSRAAINSLLFTSEDDEHEQLTDPAYLEYRERLLTERYPDLDLSKDPAIELREGDWKEEFDKAIDELVF